jgi:hypothetical protein
MVTAVFPIKSMLFVMVILLDGGRLGWSDLRLRNCPCSASLSKRTGSDQVIVAPRGSELATSGIVWLVRENSPGEPPHNARRRSA